MARSEATNGAFGRSFLVYRKLFLVKSGLQESIIVTVFLPQLILSLHRVVRRAVCRTPAPHSCGKIVLVCRSAGVCQHCGGFAGEGRVSAERRRVKTEELWVNACVSHEFFRTLHREMCFCILWRVSVAKQGCCAQADGVLHAECLVFIK